MRCPSTWLGSQCELEIWHADIHVHRADRRGWGCAQEDYDRAVAEIARLRKELAIVRLSIPLEEDLSCRIDEMCKYLAMEQGYTLNGLARLFVECQRRMAADLAEIGNLRRETKRQSAGLARLIVEWRRNALAAWANAVNEKIPTFDRRQCVGVSQAYGHCADELTPLVSSEVKKS